MDRYYFDLEDSRSQPDKEGTQLPDFGSARREAVKMLGQVLRDRSKFFWNDPQLKLTVRDEADLILMRLTVFGTIASRPLVIPLPVRP